MRFKVWSLGGKLIVVATCILLICMFLFTVLTWNLLQFYSEHQARNKAQTHLALVKQAYQAHTTTLSHILDKFTYQVSPTATADQTKALMTIPFSQQHLSLLSLVTSDHRVLAQLDNWGSTNAQATSAMNEIIDQVVQNGQPVASLVSSTALVPSLSASDTTWTLSIAVPLHDPKNTGTRVLFAAQPIDSYFAQLLTQRSGANVVICMSKQIQGATGNTLKNLDLDHEDDDHRICSVGNVNLFSSAQHYLTLAGTTKSDLQSASSSSLTVVTVEPLYNIGANNPRLLLIIIGMAVFIFALGVIMYTFVMGIFFIRPLRRLQAHVRSVVAVSAGKQVPRTHVDELDMLSRSFSLLSESLENESQAMTEQMRNILIMSDALISTLNLEHLLGEIVSRLGTIMQVQHVTLLLYGREMHSPWAVAQWSGQVIEAQPPSLTSPEQAPQGAVMVHADPDSDITLAVTSKMAAIPNLRTHPASGKKAAIPGMKTPQTGPIMGVRRSRIPRPALRDLDMILARMVIQRHKIAYGEDILAIYQERQEHWAKVALDADYRSTIAVPLLLQDQAIGAIMLYSTKPHQVSSRDTFLLSTAAVQASMAIQNALLFAEVNEKNIALERANQLKSQFLANVTHELRTPLHSIISYGALILEGFLDGELTAEQEEHVQFMVRRAEDLSHLVDDMLDLSKIEADHIEVKLEQVELHPCLMEVVTQLKPLANNKELYLNLEMAETLPKAMADSHRLRQVVINLVSNALKFTEKGGVTIRCMLLPDEETLQVAVDDTGIGISPAALGYIFEAFRQADDSTTRRFGGTGLGLTIAKKLIELQGGEIAVESMPGHGTTFSFTLPAVSPYT